MANSNSNDAYYACLEKCLFEPLFKGYSKCNQLDLACACGNGVWDQIYGCTQGSCSSYKASISASAQSYCSAVSQLPKQGSAQTVTVTASGSNTSRASSLSYATTTTTTTVTSLPANAAGPSGSGVSISRTTITISNPTNTATSASNNEGIDCQSIGLATPAIAGIAVGSLLIGMAIALIAACLFFRRQKNRPRREYIPEIQEPSIAYRAGGNGSGSSASPLLVHSGPGQQQAHAYTSSDGSGHSGAGRQMGHGVPTFVGRGGGSNDERLGSPAPSYSPEQKFGPQRYQPLQVGGAGYSDHVVEHDGRERGYWNR